MSQNTQTDPPEAEQSDTDSVETSDTGAPSQDVDPSEPQSSASPPDEFVAQVEASVLQQALTAIGVLVDDAKITVSEDELSVRAIDAANVAQVSLTLNSAAFEQFSGSEGVIGVQITRFNDVVDLADSDQVITLEFDTQTRTLRLTFDDLEYTLATIDPDALREEPDAPSPDLPVSLRVESHELSRAIGSAKMVSEHVLLTTDPEEQQFRVYAEGDVDEVELVIPADELLEFSSGTADSLFSLDYLGKIERAIPRAAEVTLNLGENYPAEIHLTFAEDDGELTYLLAPRIQS